jgi:hypothetical protein
MYASAPLIRPPLVPVRGEPLPTDQYKAAIFFDNDHKKIDQVAAACSLIRGVTVPETSIKSSQLAVKYTDEPLRTIISESGGEDNIYIKVANANGQVDELYDPVSGINAEHIGQLTSWLSETAAEGSRAVLLDWDRTITKVEGVLLPKYIMPDVSIGSMFQQVIATGGSIGAKTETDLIEDMLKIICGGPARLAMLRDMCDRIKDSGAHLIILTNNDSCITKSFKQLVDGLVPKPGPPTFLACSKFAPFYGDKGARLRSNSIFHFVCPRPGAPAPATGGAGSAPSAPAPAPASLPSVTHMPIAGFGRSSSPTKRKFVNLTGNNTNLYGNSKHGGKRNTRKHKRSRKRTVKRRGKVRKN